MKKIFVIAFVCLTFLSAEHVCAQRERFDLWLPETNLVYQEPVNFVDVSVDRVNSYAPIRDQLFSVFQYQIAPKEGPDLVVAFTIIPIIHMKDDSIALRLNPKFDVNKSFDNINKSRRIR